MGYLRVMFVCNCNGNQAGGYDFKYTGEACPSVSLQDGVEYCSDYNGDTKPDLVRIVVTEGGSTKGLELYSGTIRTGGTVLLGDIPYRIRIDVTSINSNTVYQTVMVNTRCDSSGTWVFCCVILLLSLSLSPSHHEGDHETYSRLACV